MIHQGVTSNLTQHSLTTIPIPSSPTHTHLVAVPCANSAFIYGLNIKTKTKEKPHTFVHLFRSTPSPGLVTCSGVLFQPTPASQSQSQSQSQTQSESFEPLLAISTVSLSQSDTGTPITIGIVQMKPNPLAPASLICRPVATIAIPPDYSILGNRETCTTMSFHPLHSNVMIVCPRVSSGVCYHLTWNSIGESDVVAFQAKDSHGPVTTCCFSPLGDLLLTSDANHAVRVWSIDVQQKEGYRSGNSLFRTSTNVSTQCLHRLAPFSPSSGAITVLNWYIDTMGREHVVGGHSHGSISVWSGAEPNNKYEKDKEDQSEEEQQQKDHVMYGTLTEYPSIHGSKEAVRFLHCDDISWKTMSVRGIIRRFILRDSFPVDNSISTALQLQPKVGTTTLLKTTANASVLTTPAVSSKSKRQQQQQQQRQRTNRCTTPKEVFVKKITCTLTTPTTPMTSIATMNTTTTTKISNSKKTPLTKKITRKKPKQIPFGRSSPTMRDPNADALLNMEAKITSHRFSTSLSNTHSRIKQTYHRPPPFPLPSMRNVLETETLDVMQPSCGKALRGIQGIGMQGGNRYSQVVVLTELGLRVVDLCLIEKDMLLSKQKDNYNDIMQSSITTTKEEVRIMTVDEPLKAWQKHAVGSVHRRYRLPPAVNTNEVVINNRTRKEKGSDDSCRIEQINKRLQNVEGDLNEIRDSFKAFAREMQRDLNQALTMVGKIIATRPPRC